MDTFYAYKYEISKMLTEMKSFSLFLEKKKFTQNARERKETFYFYYYVSFYKI